MRILLVNNNTIHLSALKRSLIGHDIEVQTYKPGLKFNDYDKDLVILSGGGGEGQEINDVTDVNAFWYDDEMEFVRTTKKPVVGVCMGFEVIAKAHGQAVPQLDKLVFETGAITPTAKGHQLLRKSHFKQYEAHRWYVPRSPEGFVTLAESEYGVEIMLNPFRRQIGSQFHPELGGSLKLESLIQAVKT